MTTNQKSQLSISLLATAAFAFIAISSVPVSAAYISYHDLGAINGLESTGNITTHQSGPSGAGVNSLDTTAKDLISYLDGIDTGVDFSISGANAMDSRTNVTGPPAVATPADLLFNVPGLNLNNGIIYEGGTSGSGATTFTFTGLDASRKFDLAFYGDRTLATDGVERFTLGGADAASNVSSVGVVTSFISDMETRPNAAAGNVVRWTNIDPGVDGIITVTMDPEFTSANNIAYVSALRLEEMSTLNGTPIYRETFGNDSGGDQGLGYSDWIGYYGSGATLLPDTGNPRGDVPRLAGASTSSGPINSDLDSNELDNGVTGTGFGRLLWPSGGGVSPALVYTEEFAIDRSLFAIDTIRWDQATNGGGESFQVAVEIGGNWYVSGQVFTGPNNNSSGTFGANAGEMVLDFEVATWQSLAFTPGATLGSPGGFVALPGGDITAFGLYGSYNTTMWFDTFTIEAEAINIVPEPSSYVLATLGLLGLTGLRLRRRRQS